MKNLTECKEFFKDLYKDCLQWKGFEKSSFDSTERARLETFCEALGFIFGEQFTKVKQIWAQEALNEFYNLSES